ncbi:hypothetical protein ACQJBY_066639 [Aegilops geniculata]
MGSSIRSGRQVSPAGSWRQRDHTGRSRQPNSVCATAQSGIIDVGDAAVTIQLDLNSTCEGLSLSAPNSEQSTGKDDPQAPGWTKSSCNQKQL